VSVDILKSDFALTRDVGTPSALGIAATGADSWGSLDLAVVPGGKGGLRVPGMLEPADAGVVSGRENLAQALTLRLLTPFGSLAPLGHPNYGSRLVSLIGRLNDQTTRNLARLYTIEAVAQERRVAKLLDLAVTTPDERNFPSDVTIAFTVLPVHDGEPLALAVDVQL
jgi:phage baseplate assembly protein W